MRVEVSMKCKVKAKIWRDRRAQAWKCEALSLLHLDLYTYSKPHLDPHSYCQDTRS